MSEQLNISANSQYILDVNGQGYNGFYIDTITNGTVVGIDYGDGEVNYKAETGLVNLPKSLDKVTIYNRSSANIKVEIRLLDGNGEYVSNGNVITNNVKVVNPSGQRLDTTVTGNVEVVNPSGQALSVVNKSHFGNIDELHVYDHSLNNTFSSSAGKYSLGSIFIGQNYVSYSWPNSQIGSIITMLTGAVGGSIIKTLTAKLSVGAHVDIGGRTIFMGDGSIIHNCNQIYVPRNHSVFFELGSPNDILRITYTNLI